MDKLMVIKLFASNYARDLLFTYISFEKSINILKYDYMIMNSKNVFVVAMFMIIFVGISNQLAMASSSSSSQSSKIGFKDGCADAPVKHPTSPTDLHFNQHPNAHHHSKIYLLKYAQGLVTCGK
jgi:hypothetical protein